jgi:hypothetical protein
MPISSKYFREIFEKKRISGIGGKEPLEIKVPSNQTNFSGFGHALDKRSFSFTLKLFRIIVWYSTNLELNERTYLEGTTI